MFTERRPGSGIFFAGTYSQNTQPKNTVENGDQVVLHIDEESVLVKDILLGDSRYSGHVYGFEPSFSIELGGIKLDDEVKFEEKHIVSCSSEN